MTRTKYNVYGKPVLQICTDKDGKRQIMGTWEYDSFGQLTKSVAGGFCYTYEYRPDGKLLNKWNSGRKVLSCTYYRDGSLKSRTDVSGKTVFYEYDQNGRLKYLKEGNGTENIENPDDNSAITLTEYRYTNAGRIKEIITANGIRTFYDYDEDGNVSRLTIGDGTEEGLLYDAFLLYDLNGNRTKKTGRRLDTAGKQAEMAVSYRYDSMNRLTNEDRNGAGERYAYDLCGNRLLKEQYRGSFVDAAEGYRYNERNELTERITAGSLTAYRYDKNGSIVSEEQEGRRSEYRYDLLNRQTYVKTLDGKEQENFYDGEGLRAGLIAAMRDIPGYNRMDAPAIQLDGPPNVVGTEHYYATFAQRGKGGGTYGSERGIAYMSLRKAGLFVDDAKAAVRGADGYFMGQLGLTLDSTTRIPSNRRQ